MRVHLTCLLLIGAASLGGCALDGTTSELTTSGLAAVPDAAPKSSAPTRALKGEATRVFVFAGLDAKCNAVERHDYLIEKAPTQGKITFQKAQPTTVQYSVSGKCIGAKVPGTAVLYTPNAEASGIDTFTVAARQPNGERVTRQFNVAISE